MVYENKAIEHAADNNLREEYRAIKLNGSKRCSKCGKAAASVVMRSALGTSSVKTEAMCRLCAAKQTLRNRMR